MGRYVVVQSKDLDGCWCALRYLKECERCGRVENCDKPEAKLGRLVLAEKALAYWKEKTKAEVERAQAKVEQLRKELEG